ncbi:hypothetical protein BOV90_10330 [Solemya velum gill symbiont]|uniref:Uncharacterized protein n=1 Tax=Solemya velum gill symbiont TaxID=2340 RepID=A0A0B0H849_SOVGS|nr:hypothetical protein JV46_08180 [Solemya velum gill symbiont]OOY35085.1 hypothetical protein BOV88_07140 [Solemya velum gill symbiont]OOY37788.1 hypothetical protein BOV89_06050 [Solemya velum gill symbiont]OOY39251.1 hypothetical protein BOV90_10330 [Solemya velum gill symbiont]OOY43424.1 hypothetical protein BOV91_04080 [Solemya velum gill symbiont]
MKLIKRRMPHTSENAAPPKEGLKSWRVNDEKLYDIEPISQEISIDQEIIIAKSYSFEYL